MKTAIEKNKEYAERFVQPLGDRNKLRLDPLLREILEMRSIKKIIDLGCGDGAFVIPLKRFFPSKKVFGVDISPRRIGSLKSSFPKENFYCLDACNTGLRTKFDMVYSSQVIEHVGDDKRLIKEADRLLKKGGYLFVSSVIKKPFAFYKYRNNGKFGLDPTHEREYRNSKEFLDLFKKFRLVKYQTLPVRRVLFGGHIRVPGYYIIEGLWQKIK